MVLLLLLLLLHVMKWWFRSVFHWLLPIAAATGRRVLLHGWRQRWRQRRRSHVCCCWQPHETAAARWGNGVDAEHMHVIINSSSSNSTSSRGVCMWRCRLLGTLPPCLLLLNLLLLPILLLLVCAWLVWHVCGVGQVARVAHGVCCAGVAQQRVAWRAHRTST
jgi:hypothetical protein